MERKYSTVRELPNRSPQKKGSGKAPARKQKSQAKQVARDAKTGKFVSTGHRWEITERTGKETIVVSTSASSSEAIESIVKKRKSALIRLAEK